MKRLLIRSLILIVVLVALGGFLVGMYADSLVKTGIETGGSESMGVETTVDSVGIGLLSGTLNLGGLNVKNPQGYEGHFLKLSEGDVAVSLRSLLSDTIEVPTFKLDGLDVTLFKHTGGSNYQSILDHIGGGSSGGTGSGAGTSSDDGKKLIIRNLELTNITAHVSVGLGDRELAKVDLNIPKIQLKDVGSDDGGAALDEVMGTLVQALLQAVAENGVDLPAALLNDLKGQLANFDSLDDLGFAVSGDVSQTVQDVTEQLKDVTENLPDEIGDVIPEGVDKALEEGLGGLLGGKKD